MSGRQTLPFLIAGVLLATALTWATNREYDLTYASQGARSGLGNRLPSWLADQWNRAIRARSSWASILTGLNLSVAAMTIAMRRRHRLRAGRFGPGHVAALLASALTLTLVVVRWLPSLWLGLGPPPAVLAPGVRAIPLFVNFFQFWNELDPQVSWSILGAWIVLVATGRWRPQPDTADRIGRALGWGWLALIPMQGIVCILAWV